MGWLYMQSLGGHYGPRQYLDAQFTFTRPELTSKVLRSALVGMHVYYTFWKYAKLWELRQLERLGKPVPLPSLDEEEGRWELPWMKDKTGS